MRKAICRVPGQLRNLKAETSSETCLYKSRLELTNTVRQDNNPKDSAAMFQLAFEPLLQGLQLNALPMRPGLPHSPSFVCS